MLVIHESLSDVDMSATAEKYKYMKDELLHFLFENLYNLCQLEKEIYIRSVQLNNEKLDLGIPSHQTHPHDKGLWAEYKDRYREMIMPICTETLIARGFAGSFGEPAEYDYLNTGCEKIFFIMKSRSRAVVEIHYEYGIGKMHQFVLQLKDGEWKINEKNYGFTSEIDRWHKDHI
ncbi:hypothetical protein PCCS19_26370 [Paenibacillus sp. CCS19]|uniref:hypothetical protein n=1 Tax=Paenibacillus sp. CCS19 TaxID=3158387 RepID=UPI0025672905|nr:hypothetical protein [Paenibacillus cellulosilyticus]GMK39583.1 hypothetical protein PCCS19_26370 [Paenibacillus cellulosilyticus]